MARRRINTTKYEIIQAATRFFLEDGYSKTSPKMICDELNLSTGNITYYFHTKEHLLAELIDMLCAFQWLLMEKEADEGYSSVMALCLELTAMVSICEEDPIAKDLYIAAYSNPITLEIIRKSDSQRAKAVFAETCKDWTDKQFAEAETLVSGIEYATLMTTPDSPDLETRIAGALDIILSIYGIPKETRDMKIEKVLKMDYRAVGRRVLTDFKTYVAETNEHTLRELLYSRFGKSTEI